MQIIMGQILLALAALLSVFISVYFLLYGKPSKLLYSFIYCQIIMLVWSLGHMAEISAVNTAIKWTAVCVENFAICFVGFSWLLFSIHFTRNRLSEKKRQVFLLSIIPVVIYILFLTNPYHKLVYPIFEMKRIEFGFLFWVHIFFVYVYICAGILMMIGHFRRTLGQEKKQSFLLLMAVMIPFVLNIAHLLKIVILKFDITPISFSISLLLFAIATFRFRFLNTIPAALRKVFDTVDDSIILVDNEGSIISRNISFAKAFDGFWSANINEFARYLRERTTPDQKTNRLFEEMIKNGDEPLLGEIELISPGRMFFRVAVQPVHDNRNSAIGRVVSFTDITSYRELAEELTKKNSQLVEANYQLKRHMLAVEELAVLKERSRVARDIHDTLGHTLTLLTKMQEAAIGDLESDRDKTLETMKKANEVTRNGLKELRLSIHNMMPGREESHTLQNDLNNLAASFGSSGVCVELTYDGDANYDSPIYSQTVLRVCQEAVTNSVKHGNADRIHIILRFSEKSISLFIIDNGSGCGQINKGYGLTGMEERVSKLGGSIRFGSDGESGFNIHAEIPLEAMNHG